MRSVSFPLFLFISTTGEDGSGEDGSGEEDGSGRQVGWLTCLSVGHLVDHILTVVSIGMFNPIF